MLRSIWFLTSLMFNRQEVEKTALEFGRKTAVCERLLCEKFRKHIEGLGTTMLI